MKNIIIIFPRKKLLFLVMILLYILIMLAVVVIINASSQRNVLGGRIIVVDAGHGGVDGGANNSIIKEKDVNLDVALYLQEKLESKGARVIMTRTSDIELSKSNKIDRSRYISDLNARVNIINNSSASMFVSIHTNSNKNKPSTRGMIAFYANSHPHNRDMAYIFQNVFNTYGFEYNGKTYTSHHIPQKGKYYILVNAKIPGIIIETGFITNAADLSLLRKSEYREYIAESIYQGIVNYYLCSDKLPQNFDKAIDIEEENIIEMAPEDMVYEHQK